MPQRRISPEEAQRINRAIAENREGRSDRQLLDYTEAMRRANQLRYPAPWEETVPLDPSIGSTPRSLYADIDATEGSFRAEMERLLSIAYKNRHADVEEQDRLAGPGGDAMSKQPGEGWRVMDGVYDDVSRIPERKEIRRRRLP